MKKKLISFFALFIVLTLCMGTSVSAAKEKFDTWQDVARAMGKVFDDAIANVEKEDLDTAYKDMNKAYYKYYETQGFEATVMNAISAKRVTHIEGQFRLPSI